MNDWLTSFVKKHLKILSISIFVIAFLILMMCLYQWFTFDYTLVPERVLDKHQASYKTAPSEKKLKDFPVFGNYLPKDKTIPKSLLDLTLVGILKSKNSKDSQAIIKLSNGREKTFHVDDLLPGNAKIIKINDTEVLLTRTGIVERLVLDKNKLTFDKPLPPLELEHHD